MSRQRLSRLLCKIRRDNLLHFNPNKFPKCWNHTNSSNKNLSLEPISVNYFLTRRCNYKCKFCFHTAKTSFVLPLEEAKKGLKLLQNNGMKKINFAGGEPFIENRGKYLGELCKYSKEILNLESVSIISNGSLITEKWMTEYSKFIDILGISCDSFNANTLYNLGRIANKNNIKVSSAEYHINKLYTISEWCNKYEIIFKINTVINKLNYNEIMLNQIKLLNPKRWKVFQCLLIKGENMGTENDLRNALDLVINENEFNIFINNHKSLNCLVSENNNQMTNSYILLDEYMRFLDCTNGYKTPSKSILDIGVENAIQFSGFDKDMFYNRGGLFNWSKQLK